MSCTDALPSLPEDRFDGHCCEALSCGAALVRPVMGENNSDTQRHGADYKRTVTLHMVTPEDHHHDTELHLSVPVDDVTAQQFI